VKLLEKIRVIDLGMFVTGPLAAQFLADFGAEVIKVEPPKGGDPLRAYFGDQLYSPNFQSQNRNKLSVTLDYSKPEDLQILEQLCAGADIFIVNSRPGVADKRGIGYSDIAKINPRILYCSITGFGADGPYAQWPAFDNVGQAISGWASRVRQSNEPRVASPLVADPMTAYVATMGILAALFDRERTGKGRFIEVNMLESMIAALVEPMTRYFVTGAVPPIYERAAISQAYNVTCKDGKVIGLHASALDKFFRAMCRAIGKEDLIDRYPARQDRVKNYSEIAREVDAAFKSRTRSEWLPILAEADFPFAPQYELDEITTDPQVRHLDVFEQREHPKYGRVTLQRRPVRVDGERDVQALPPPGLGEHTEDILRTLGLDDERIAGLRRNGVI
jgi:crotonobetainyl-CoA:carnitine CoA-transferase CaiB-like acyl-CoA transferase